jgi:hypothetical protein
MPDFLPEAIGASSASNVWVGGRPYSGGGKNHLLRWNGSRWSAFSVEQSFMPRDIAALGAKNIWVIGHGDYAKRWNGSTWRNHPLGISSRAIDASSASNVWVVGHAKGQPAAARWNGSAWRTMPLPRFSGIVRTEIAPALLDVEVISDKSVWAVGLIPVKDSAGQLTTKAVFAHWNGTKWTTALGANGTGYYQVEPDGKGGIWIQSKVSELRHRSRNGVWSTSRMATPAGGSGRAYDLAFRRGTKTVWAAGYVQPGKNTYADVAYWRND